MGILRLSINGFAIRFVYLVVGLVCFGNGVMSYSQYNRFIPINTFTTTPNTVTPPLSLALNKIAYATVSKKIEPLI